MDYDAKVNQLVEILSLGYEGEYSLIHGDFYPGNLLNYFPLKESFALLFGQFFQPYLSG